MAGLPVARLFIRTGPRWPFLRFFWLRHPGTFYLARFPRGGFLRSRCRLGFPAPCLFAFGRMLRYFFMIYHRVHFADPFGFSPHVLLGLTQVEADVFFHVCMLDYLLAGTQFPAPALYSRDVLFSVSFSGPPFLFFEFSVQWSGGHLKFAFELDRMSSRSHGLSWGRSCLSPIPRTRLSFVSPSP